MKVSDIFGQRVPDSKMARDATQLIRDTASELLFQHSVRVYFWAALIGQRQSLKFDAELLYTAAMFHDFGLTSGCRTSQLRFEVDGANAARAFLHSHGLSAHDIERVWLAIALHTTPGITQYLDPEIALLHAATAMDVVGVGYEQFTDAERDAVTTAYPRGADFKNGIIDAFYEGMKHRPDSTLGTLNDDYLACKDPNFRRVDICRLILSSPWPS